jgi:hypothetical protein
MTQIPSLSRSVLVAIGSMLTLVIGVSAQESGLGPMPNLQPPPVTAVVAEFPTGSTPDYGTAHLTYEQVAAAAFAPMVSPSSFGTTTVASGQVLRIAGGTPGALVYFAAPVRIPSGALVKSLELDECDSTGVPGYVQGSLVESDSLGNVIASAPLILSDGAGCKSLSEDLTSQNMVADNHTKHFFLYAAVGVAGNVGLAGMNVGYQLQVSPAPVTATFTDVPTSDFAFQFVEAFSAAGITAGCDVVGPKFCPDRNVTRREMAVFFAKALGLQFQ